MQGVFDAPERCHISPSQEQKLAGDRAIWAASLLLLALTMQVHAQTTATISQLALPASTGRHLRLIDKEYSEEVSSNFPGELPATPQAHMRAESSAGIYSESLKALPFDTICAEAICSAWFGAQPRTVTASDLTEVTQSQSVDAEVPRENSKTSRVRPHESPDLNRNIYYRNRLEFAVDVGWHPVNIPFIYDFAVGDTYNMTPLKYTLVPIIASMRWHVTNIGWRWVFRGNMDFTFSGSITAIPRGPETHYYAFMFGIRRNFVYRNWRAVPFFEQRGGAGMIDAKEPLGVVFAQGQNLTFTYSLGVGVRYNFDSKYSLSGGMNYMHISNGYLSEPKFANYGINVYGPMFGFDMRLGKRHHSAE
jgi:hypothetical protein